ncbi:hypothetical protein E9998_12745 [Glycomyces paridis]|uniref:Uncharacterized protein n=1 Tax=Glycomyces paridis TaxID=2126555 RepID=A0A4S8PJ72_9ACTN|nr:hypothetical protein E9998_12745 [Glycomyces paridis]
MEAAIELPLRQRSASFARYFKDSAKGVLLGVLSLGFSAGFTVGLSFSDVRYAVVTFAAVCLFWMVLWLAVGAVRHSANMRRLRHSQRSR